MTLHLTMPPEGAQTSTMSGRSLPIDPVKLSGTLNVTLPSEILKLAAALTRLYTPAGTVAVALTVQGVTVFLTPEENLHMAVTLSLGHTLSMSIAFMDQNGNPMLTTPTPDAAPAWSDTTPATETLAPSGDGLTCTGTPVAVGTDTVSLALAVGGAAFSATLDVTVTAAPQVLTSIGIVPVVN